MSDANSPDGARARPQELTCKSNTSDAEAELEVAIEYARQCLYAAPTWDEKLVRWREWVRLLDQRTTSRQRFLARLEQIQSPPSTSARLGNPSAECRGNAAGGVP